MGIVVGTGPIKGKLELLACVIKDTPLALSVVIVWTYDPVTTLLRELLEHFLLSICMKRMRNELAPT
jgi:hypothetical protein